jgi:hypothetical protein
MWRLVVVYDFPAKSTDLPRGSTVLAEYLGAIDKLLVCLVNTGSLEVLEVLFGVLKEEEHVNKRQVDAALQRFVSNLSDEQAKQTFGACYKYVAVAFVRMLDQDQPMCFCCIDNV